MTDKEKRNLFIEEIQKKVLGPGFDEDILLSEDLEHELLNVRPCDAYYTGILFPRTKDQNSAPESAPNVQLTGNDLRDDDSATSNDDDFDFGAIPVSNEQQSQEEPSNLEVDEESNESEAESWQVKQCPYFMGLVTCLDGTATNATLHISYARYETAQPTDVKVKLNAVSVGTIQEVFSLLINQNAFHQIAVHNNVNHWEDFAHVDEQERTISLTRRLYKTTVTNRQDENGHLVEETKEVPVSPSDCLFDRDFYNDPEKAAAADVIGRLFSSNFYRRIPIVVPSINIDISSDVQTTPINIDINGNVDVQYLYKVFSKTGLDGVRKKYLKVLLQNAYVVDRRQWRSYCLYQPVVRVESEQLVSYSEVITNDIDEENNETEYIYRNEPNYGKGVGVAIRWDTSEARPLWVETTYIPLVDVKKFSNKARENAPEIIFQCCNVYDLSIWSNVTDSDLIVRLRAFVNDYALWQQVQANLANAETAHQQEAQNIVDRQAALLRRLTDNIDYLESNVEAMKCFRIANTAMYIQMVVSKDERFKKGRSYISTEHQEGIFNNLEFFINRPANPTAESSFSNPTYYPFQLAFLLMNVKSTMDPNDSDRNDTVDLIWFPTGGGKTEAYLALTALTIVARRRCETDDVAGGVTGGVSVIMRYTLRLLTSQQFERASYLICALEFLRRKDNSLNLGGDDNPITIGLWIGSSSTPNKIDELKKGKYSDFFNDINGRAIGRRRLPPTIPSENPFPVSCCPWCGTRLCDINNAGDIQSGYYQNSGELACTNPTCHFGRYGEAFRLPILYIDEQIYDNPPTLLFATVDKFALITNDEGAKLFGKKNDNTYYKKPDLIIQDELHLISGPLGSMVGLFESVVEKMATDGDVKPKIIASTATTRNTRSLVKQLYHRDVCIFPPSGLEYSDNYFSYIIDPAQNQNIGIRRHLGIMPTGHSSVMTEVNLTALLIVTRIKLFAKYIQENGLDINVKRDVWNHIFTNYNEVIGDLDRYWTTVLYYNSIKDLGRAKSRIPQEVMERVRFLLKSCIIHYPALDFITERFDIRNQELTSRQDSSRIKSLLTDAESATKVDVPSVADEVQGKHCRVTSNMDIVQASNMISVGIDISRWNLMMMMGQPRSTSEYIQSSSRVARTWDGLVINLFNPFRNREYSLFENYTSFHNTYYKYVEPLSATPFTEMTIDKLLLNIMICYMKHIKGISPDQVQQTDIEELKDFLSSRCNPGDNQIRQYIDGIVDRYYAIWTHCGTTDWRTLETDFRNEHIEKMQSLRSVDPNSYIKIDQIQY